MDINDLRGLGTVFATAAFLGVCFWAYSGRKKQDFEEAASLPFADDASDPDSHKLMDSKNNDEGAAK
ncbi:MAG: cbb3-type cytochrome oxidase subunit 3 [Endozoicomonas sp.]